MSLYRPLLTLVTALLIASPFAHAEVCSLNDGREFVTDSIGNVASPVELVGYRLRERDDMGGFEIFRPWSDMPEALLVAGCVAGGYVGDGRDPTWSPSAIRGGFNAGRDSGGNCNPKHCNNDGRY